MRRPMRRPMRPKPPPQFSNDGASEEGDGDNLTMRVGGAVMRVMKGVAYNSYNFDHPCKWHVQLFNLFSSDPLGS